MLVKDIMNRRTRSVIPETSIAEAMLIMCIYKADWLPVAINKKLIGLVTLKGILDMLQPEEDHVDDLSEAYINRLQAKYGPLTRADIHRVMDSSTRSVSSTVPVNEALSIMHRKQLFHLPVTEDQKLVGVIDYHAIKRIISDAFDTRAAA